MSEAWADLKLYRNHQVSTHGNVRNKKRLNVLRPILDRDGYPRLSLGSVDNVPVHRLVAMTFLTRLPEHMQVNHIDGVKTNNHYMNLEWVTASHNIKHAIRLGLQDPMIGLAKAVEVNRRPVRVLETGLEYASVKECAQDLGVFPQNVQRVLSGERRVVRGLHVEYMNGR